MMPTRVPWVHGPRERLSRFMAALKAASRERCRVWKAGCYKSLALNSFSMSSAIPPGYCGSHLAVTVSSAVHNKEITPTINVLGKLSATDPYVFGQKHGTIAYLIVNQWKMPKLDDVHFGCACGLAPFRSGPWLAVSFTCASSMLGLTTITSAGLVFKSDVLRGMSNGRGSMQG